MNKTEVLITLLGWEERFTLGINLTIEQANPRQLILLYCSKYTERTARSRQLLEDLCKKKSIEIVNQEFSYNEPVKTWNGLKDCFVRHIKSKETCLVDITTMPRDIIWTSFHFLTALDARVDYIYYPPTQYSQDWLSRESLTPRLIYQHSGIFEFSRKTALLVATGFDSERTEQLINFFEPEKTLLVFQTGDRFSNIKFNIGKHEFLLKKSYDIQKLEVNFYSADHGFSLIENEISNSQEKYNWIFCSLGPKLSAVSLYKIHCKYTGTALAYVPSNEYNPDYSVGIAEGIYGSLFAEE